MPAESTHQVENPTLAASVALRAFLATAGRLTLAERFALVDQALLLLHDNYVHLPLKQAMHAIDPVQRLRLLRARMEHLSDDTMGPEWRFHREMSSIFHSLRDLHTNYLLPEPFAGMVAFLPFLVERCHDADGDEHYLVTRLVTGFSAPGFVPGAEVTHWSGIPMSRAVALNGERFAGSNEAATLARGLESLTIRPLRIHVPPDEDWVIVTYLDQSGTERELREQWRVTENLPMMTDLDRPSTTSTNLGLDLDADERSRAKTLLYAPEVVEASQGRAEVELTTRAAAAGEDVPSSMPSVFRARSVATSSGTFGHIRIFTFSVNDPDAFVAEFVRLLGLLPQEGLILDVRGNGGGHIYASEYTLQTLTPRRIAPEPVQFINTPLNLRIVRRHAANPTGQIDLGPWFSSMEQAVETGATYSAAIPITPEDGANALGQHYCGPVVLVTDARCYSATDIFAAGFADHAAGKILGVDANTGAGGANVWTHGLLTQLLQLPDPDPDSPYAELPRGANMRVAIRRTVRVGALAGTPVEDLGVHPDQQHLMTRADLLEGNRDLMEQAGELLATMPRHQLDASVTRAGDGRLMVTVDTTGIDRVDLYLDGRPHTTADVADGKTTLELHPVAPGHQLRVEGWSQGILTVSRNQEI